jgi:hypothetical protein
VGAALVALTAPDNRTMAAKRKASVMSAPVDDEPVDPSDELSFYCLGGGNEVGRSCHILQYKGKTVMVRHGLLFLRYRLLTSDRDS